MPQIGALAAFVLLSDDTYQKVVEYPEPYSRGLSDNYTTYIECTSDEIFSLQFSVIPSKLARFGLTGANLAFFAEIDGKRVSYGAVCGPRGFENGDGGVAIWDYKMKGEFFNFFSSAIYPFRFAKVQAAEKASVAIKEREIISKLGEIVVSVHHIEYDNELVALPVSKVGERHDDIGGAALKGASLSHTVRLGNRIIADIPPIRRSRFVEGKSEPIQVFRFKYRSKEALQELGILQPPAIQPCPTLIHQQPSSEPLPRAPLTTENLLKNFPQGKTTPGVRGRPDDASSIYANQSWIEPVKLRIPKEFGFSKDEEINMEEAVNMLSEPTLEEGEAREKDDISRKRKAGNDDSDDDCAFLSGKSKKRKH